MFMRNKFNVLLRSRELSDTELVWFPYNIL